MTGQQSTFPCAYSIVTATKMCRTRILWKKLLLYSNKSHYSSSGLTKASFRDKGFPQA